MGKDTLRGHSTSWTLGRRSIHFCLFIIMFYYFFCLYKVGYVRELYLVPGKVHKMKTLSLRPALFGNQTVLNMNLLSILEFPPYLKVKVFFPFSTKIHRVQLSSFLVSTIFHNTIRGHCHAFSGSQSSISSEPLYDPVILKWLLLRFSYHISWFRRLIWLCKCIMLFTSFRKIILVWFSLSHLTFHFFFLSLEIEDFLTEQECNDIIFMAQTQGLERSKTLGEQSLDEEGDGNDNSSNPESSPAEIFQVLDSDNDGSLDVGEVNKSHFSGEGGEGVGSKKTRKVAPLWKWRTYEKKWDASYIRRDLNKTRTGPFIGACLI